jgi:hypothetical protein
MRQDWGWIEPAESYVEHYWKACKDMENFAREHAEGSDFIR